MSVPSPFQQRQSGLGDQITPAAPAAPVTPAANDAQTPNFPGAPAPAAPPPVKQAPAPKVSPAVSVAAPAPAAPAAVGAGANAVGPATGTPPAAMPAYIAEMLQKGQDALHKKVQAALAPAPAPTSTPATPPAEAPARTAAVTTPTASAQATATPDATTTETPEQIAARAASMQSVEVQHNADGSVKTDANGQPVAATPGTVDYTITATDTPEQAAQKSQAQQTQDALMAQAQKWATAKEDPAYVAQFNKLLVDSAISNQAAIDATKRAVSENPSLAGQPAGDAMLGLKAIQLNTSLDNLKANLSIEAAKAVADMNKYGFEAVYKLNQDKMSQDEKDALAYGQVLDRMISAGADEATLQAYYDKTIKPLLGNKDITFDQFRSPAERQALIAGVQTDGLQQMRDALDRGDTPGALQALEAAYSPARQTELGKSLIANTDIDKINSWLKDAGYAPITTAADLIGREDDVFTAQQISQAKAKISESPLQPKIDALLSSLKGKVDITDPQVLDAVHEYVYQQEYGDPTKPDVLPWDSDVTSYKYKDWEIFNPATGTTVDAGNQFYDPKTNPEPAPGSAAYAWRSSLDGAWQKYLAANPDSKNRLSRDDWFTKFKTDYTDYTKKNPDGSLDGFLNSGWKAPAATVLEEDLPAAKAKGEAALKANADVTKIDFSDPNVMTYLNSLPATLPAMFKDPTAFAKANIGDWVKIGDQFYRVDDGIEGQYGSNDRHKNVMKLTQKDGTVVYMRDDGSFTKTPPPPSSSQHAFKDWYDAIGVTTPAAPATPAPTTTKPTVVITPGRGSR